MKVLFTLCGRAGSKGVKNKNIKEFIGLPLPYYSLSAIVNSVEKLGDEIDADIVLNTDSNELANIVSSQNRVVVDVLWRDEALSGDSVPKVSVIKDCYKRSCSNHSTDYDMVVDLDITSPLRTGNDVINAIKKKQERPEVDVVYSVTESRRNPFFNMVKEENGFFVKAIASSYTSRQQAPVFYDMNASIYVYSTLALKNKDDATFFNDGAYAVRMKDTAVLDIDSEEDFELMEVIAEYLFKTYPEYSKIRNEAMLINESRRHE